MGIFTIRHKIMKLVPFILVNGGASKQHKRMSQTFFKAVLKD